MDPLRPLNHPNPNPRWPSSGDQGTSTCPWPPVAMTRDCKDEVDRRGRPGSSSSVVPGVSDASPQDSSAENGAPHGSPLRSVVQR